MQGCCLAMTKTSHFAFTHSYQTASSYQHYKVLT